MIGAFFIERTGSAHFSEGIESGHGLSFMAVEEVGVDIPKLGMEMDFLRLRGGLSLGFQIKVSDLENDLAWAPKNNITTGSFPASPLLNDIHYYTGETFEHPLGGGGNFYEEFTYHTNTLYRFNSENKWEVLGQRGTYIDETGVYTGLVAASQIVVGTLTGFTIQNSTNANTRVKIDTNGLQIGGTSVTTAFAGATYTTTFDLGYAPALGYRNFIFTAEGSNLIELQGSYLGPQKPYFPIGLRLGNDLHLGAGAESVSMAELYYLHGVTSNIQTQLNGKSPTGHTHSGYMNSFQVSAPFEFDNIGGNLTLLIANASSSARGVLTSTDWSTFNSKAAGDHNHNSTYAPISHVHTNSANNVFDIDTDHLEWYSFGSSPNIYKGLRVIDVATAGHDHNSVYASLTGSYENPSWITKLAASKINISGASGVVAYFDSSGNLTYKTGLSEATQRVITSITVLTNGYVSQYTYRDIYIEKGLITSRGDEQTVLTTFT